MYKGTAESRYRYLEPEKSLYLDRAIECSKYTLPTLITDNDRSTGKNSYTKIKDTGFKEGLNILKQRQQKGGAEKIINKDHLVNKSYL